MRLAALLALCAFTLSCGSDDAKLSQVLLVVRGGLEVRTQTTRLEVALKSGPLGQREAWKSHEAEVFENFAWPASLALVPKSDADGTGFEVLVTAYNGTAKLVESRVISAFISSRTLLLEVPLGDGCINYPACGDAQTCTVSPSGGASCQTAEVDPKTLKDYDGKNLDNDRPGDADDDDGSPDGADDGSPDGADDGDPGPPDAGQLDAGSPEPCEAEPGAVEACFNGQDDDCNGQTDCEDAACTPTTQCVPGDSAAGVLIAQDQACPAGFTEELVLNRGLTGGGCTGCSCTVTATTCSAEVFVYAQDFEDPNNCANDTYNRGGQRFLITKFFNEWASAPRCPDEPPVDGSTTGFRTGAITATSGSCTAHGMPVPETAGFSETKKLCKPPAVGKGCSDHNVCLPKPPEAQKALCGVVSSAAHCAATPGTWYTDFEDDRTCGACRCDNGAGGSCAGVKVQFGNDHSCNVNRASLGANERVCQQGYSPPFFLTGMPTDRGCTASSSSSGGVRGTGTTLLCCSAP